METKRRRLSAKERKKIFDMYHGHCAYCGAEVTFRGMQVDYKIPLSAGGEETLENMLPTCKKCKRGKNPLEEFYNTNTNFREYVEKYRKKHDLSVDEALQHASVREAEKYYREKEREENETRRD